MAQTNSTAVLDNPSGRAALANAAGRWQLDPANTTIEFHTEAMWGLAKVKGTFAALDGSGVVSEQGDVSGDLTVDATSIDTRNKRRDKHLRGADFFEVTAHPAFTFTVLEVTPSADGTLKITGTLLIKDRSHTVEFVAASDHPSRDRVTLTAEATIDRRHWGMSWARLGARVVNRVVVRAAFVRS
jgi:polyisoprenoid-binding protein YceI